MSRIVRPNGGLPTVIPEAQDYEEAENEGVWYPICPYCGLPTTAEPDAEDTVCNNCDARFALCSID